MNDKILEFLHKKIKKVTKKPGVYFFKDASNNIIYIGKAKDLRNRLNSYFREQEYLKTAVMMQNVKFIDYVITDSERTALLWENKLIKKYTPKYNISLKDDKTYPFLKLVNTQFPYLLVTRKYIEDKSVYFGPYVDVRILRKLKRLIERVFLIRKCKKNLNKKIKRKPCLQYHMGMCLAPCSMEILKKDYNKIIRDVKIFLQGRYRKLIRKWKVEIKEKSNNLKFEQAEIIKKRLYTVEQFFAKNVKLWHVGEKNINEFLQSAERVSDKVEDIFPEVNRIKKIAGFDISNLSGKFAVGSRVLFENGKANKDRYRRYKIKFTKESPNDVLMMREVIRRAARNKESGDIDLYLIDGGKGQVNAAQDELAKIGNRTLVIGLAKKNEWLFKPGAREPIILDKNSSVLKLFQRIRDEAHRFAITYHKKLRRKID
ncbi:GIY-YIG nuclease family protein [bacterium]